MEGAQGPRGVRQGPRGVRVGPDGARGGQGVEDHTETAQARPSPMSERAPADAPPGNPSHNPTPRGWSTCAWGVAASAAAPNSSLTSPRGRSGRRKTDAGDATGDEVCGPPGGRRAPAARLELSRAEIVYFWVSLNPNLKLKKKKNRITNHDLSSQTRHIS